MLYSSGQLKLGQPLIMCNHNEWSYVTRLQKILNLTFLVQRTGAKTYVSKQKYALAVIVAQLAIQLHPTSEFRGSNPSIHKFIKIISLLIKQKSK